MKASGSSTVVEQSPHNSNAEGSSLAINTGTGKKKHSQTKQFSEVSFVLTFLSFSVAAIVLMAKLEPSTLNL
jgi:hypothetical protein